MAMQLYHMAVPALQIIIVVVHNYYKTETLHEVAVIEGSLIQTMSSCSNILVK